MRDAIIAGVGVTAVVQLATYAIVKSIDRGTRKEPAPAPTAAEESVEETRSRAKRERRKNRAPKGSARTRRGAPA